MNRRSFLRNILGAGVIASTNPVYFLAPPSGWYQLESGVLTSNGSYNSIWSSKTPQEIMDDINAILLKTNPMYAIGKDLDNIGKLYGISRIRSPLESDDSLRRRHLALIGGV